MAFTDAKANASCVSPVLPHTVPSTTCPTRPCFYFPLQSAPSYLSTIYSILSADVLSCPSSSRNLSCPFPTPLPSPFPFLPQEAVWFLSNVTASNRAQAQLAMDHGLVSPVVHHPSGAEFQHRGNVPGV